MRRHFGSMGRLWVGALVRSAVAHNRYSRAPIRASYCGMEDAEGERKNAAGHASRVLFACARIVRGKS